jgi:hypothetical protein
MSTVLQLCLFDPLVGIEVAMPRHCQCGEPTYYIDAGRSGPHRVSLRCPKCSSHGGWLSHEVASFLEKIVEKFGRPDKPVSVRVPPPGDGGNSSHPCTMQMKGKAMVTKAEAFPSLFLKAEDLKGPVVLKVIASNYEKLNGLDGKAKQKVVLGFAKTEKQLALNATNFDAVMDITAEEDSDNWVGHKLELYPTTTTLPGKGTVPCIRIRKPGEAQPPALAVVPATVQPAAPDLDDEIPF